MRTLQKVPEQRVCLERLRSSLTLTQSPADLKGSFSKPPHHRQLSGKMEDKIRMWKNPNSHLRPTGCVLLLPQHKKKKIRAAFSLGQLATTDHASLLLALPKLVLIE